MWGMRKQANLWQQNGDGEREREGTLVASLFKAFGSLSKEKKNIKREPKKK